jgi:hypothetical protein
METPPVEPAPEPAVTEPQAPAPKSLWSKHRTLLIIGLVILVLLIMGASASNRRKQAALNSQTTSHQTGAIPKATNVAQVGEVPVNSPAPLNLKGYFATVFTHLNKLSPLSQAMNTSCDTHFPPPSSCATDIQAYQQELLSTKSDLDQVAAPDAYAQADATLRTALNTDIDATNQALTAIRRHSSRLWVLALTEHAVAGGELNQAGAQATAVLQ